MAHMLEKNARAAYRKAAWHGLGVIAPTTDLVEFRRLAKMDYDVTRERVYCLTDDGYRQVPGQFHLMRSDDQKVLSPQTVTDRYHPIPPRVLFETAQPFVAEGWGTPDAAFTLYGGRSEVLSIRLDLQGAIPGDTSKWEHYLLFQNFHGTGSLRATLTSVRVVCHNTVTAAFGGDGTAFRIRHTATGEERFKTAVAAWEKLNAHVRQMGEKLAPLTEQLLGSDLDRILLDICEVGDPDDTPTQRFNGAGPRVRNRVSALKRHTFHSPGVSGRGTAWDLYNAVTYYNSHERTSQKQHQRVESILDGGRRKLEQRALAVLTGGAR